MAGTGKRIRYRGHKWKRIRKKIQSTRKCIHLVSGRMCVGNRRSESYDSLRFSESAQSRGHTAAKEVVGHIKDESKQAFSCLRYLRLFFFFNLCGKMRNQIILERGETVAEDTTCMLNLSTKLGAQWNKEQGCQSLVTRMAQSGSQFARI